MHQDPEADVNQEDLPLTGRREDDEEITSQYEFRLSGCGCSKIYGHSCSEEWVHTITKKHYIPESTFNYQKALIKHMRGGVWMPYLLLFYVCWIIKMYTGVINRYMILKRVLQMIIELTISVQLVSCE